MALNQKTAIPVPEQKQGAVQVIEDENGVTVIAHSRQLFTITDAFMEYGQNGIDIMKGQDVLASMNYGDDGGWRVKVIGVELIPIR